MAQGQTEQFRKTVLIVLLIAISAAFVTMISSFLLTVLLAAIFAGLAHPLYSWLLARLRGQKVVASLATLAILLVAVVGPLFGLLGVVAAEALRVTQNVRPWIDEQLSQPGTLEEYLRLLPGFEWIEPYRPELFAKAGELVGGAGTFLVQSISATTRGTVLVVVNFFIMLYTMFFFLMDGEQFVQRALYYLPLDERDERRMLDKFTSVTRATLKGTIVIGLIQGTLGGLAFWAVGVQGPVFWGTLMTALSIVPGVGAALIWVPGAIWLLLTERVWQGIALAVFCAVIVGSVDNLLRPRLVGRDTQMHELMILFSTVGGIVLFGVVGFIIGPILAALFVTIWDIYGTVFRDSLVAGGPRPGEP